MPSVFYFSASSFPKPIFYDNSLTQNIYKLVQKIGFNPILNSLPALCADLFFTPKSLLFCRFHSFCLNICLFGPIRPFWSFSALCFLILSNPLKYLSDSFFGIAL